MRRNLKVMRISGPSLKFTAASLNDLLSGLMGDRTLHAHWKPCENLNLLYKHIDFFPSTERKDWCARWKHKRPLINLVSLCDRMLYSRLFFLGVAEKKERCTRREFDCQTRLPVLTPRTVGLFDSVPLTPSGRPRACQSSVAHQRHVFLRIYINKLSPEWMWLRPCGFPQPQRRPLNSHG